LVVQSPIYYNFYSFCK